MQETFDPKKFIQMLGIEIINEFEKAGLATQSVAVGLGRESSIKMKLKSILPNGVGIGSGFVIDSFGNTSKQCDIILYEETYAAKFVINDDSSNTYYSCENVIAVGEIKSNLTKKEFKDCCDKLKKLRSLKDLIIMLKNIDHILIQYPSLQEVDLIKSKINIIKFIHLYFARKCLFHLNQLLKKHELYLLINISILIC